MESRYSRKGWGDSLRIAPRLLKDQRPTEKRDHWCIRDCFQACLSQRDSFCQRKTGRCHLSAPVDGRDHDQRATQPSDCEAAAHGLETSALDGIYWGWLPYVRSTS